MDDKKILISIVTYNSKHIFHVLDNLKKELLERPNYRVAIFDNNSNEKYKERLREYEGFVDITFFHENRGFGFGHNYNLLNATEKYFLIFNPDILLEKETLDNMLEQIESDDSISLLVPKVLNANGTPQHLIRERISVFDYALRFVPFKFVKKVFNKRLASYECRGLPDNKCSDIRICSGCFMFIRGKDFKLVNGFDERYFMYFEDTDLCLKLKKRNKRIVYTPFSSVIHYYERGAHKDPALFKIFMKSMYSFFNKWGWKLY